MRDRGDFEYNGIPVFNVGISDFMTISNGICHGNRVYTKNLVDEDFREYYKKHRGSNVGICFEGIILDLREFKNNLPQE